MFGMSWLRGMICVFMMNGDLRKVHVRAGEDSSLDHRFISRLRGTCSTHTCGLTSNEHESFCSCIVFQGGQLLAAFNDVAGFQIDLAQSKAGLKFGRSEAALFRLLD